MHTMTFDQMQRRADRTLGLVLWAEHAKDVVGIGFWLLVLNRGLAYLVKSLACNEQVASLSDAEARALAENLREIYSRMELLLRRNVIISWKRVPIVGSAIKNLELTTEDLGDIIEDLVLSCDKDFRSVIGECARSIKASATSAHSAELIGSRM